MPKIVHRDIPNMDELLAGVTVRTTTLEEGRVEARSPNYPALKSFEGPTALLARQGFNRRLLAYAATGGNIEKANAADVSPTSRDKLTCG